MTKALLFDLGNVLVAFDFKRGYQALEGVCPYPLAEIPRRIGATGLVPPYERGELSSEEFFASISAALDLRMSFQQFCDLWGAIFFPEPLLSHEFLAALHRRYRMVLVSNTNDLHFRTLERNYPLLDEFDAHVLSFRVGALKPDERMYAAAVQEARCGPAECFFTDDVRDFVEGARRYGIDAVQFQGQKHVEAELKKRGIVWE